MGNIEKLLQFSKSSGPTICLMIILLSFILFSSFMALNLKTNIIPDEPAHYALSKYFANTIKIPNDSPQTFSLGIYIEQNPVLYYWINGRIINAVRLFVPQAADRDLLVILRMVNVFFSLGTVLACFLLSREVIKHPWWQLFPVFLLVNTSMYVFLSAGVNYDNLTNLLSMLGLYFFVRVFSRDDIFLNSILWMIFIALAALTKYTILPLALAMGISWLFFLLSNKKDIKSINFKDTKTLIFLFMLIFLFAWNFSIYGVNIIRYQALLPACEEILLESQCALSPLDQRNQELAINPRMTIKESVKRGFPNPIIYAADTWIQNMLLRTFGFIGHKTYFPLNLMIFYSLLFYGTVLLGMFLFRRSSFLTFNLLGITIFYSLVLLYTNYTSELKYGFIHIALQGRYIFPVIGLIYVLFTKIVRNIPIQQLRLLFVTFTLGLFAYGGPITIIIKYQEVFSDWFI